MTVTLEHNDDELNLDGSLLPWLHRADCCGNGSDFIRISRE